MTEEQKAQRNANLARARAARKAAQQETEDAALLAAPVSAIEAEAQPDRDAEIRLARRQRLLGEDPESWDLFSDEELEAIEAEEVERARAEQKKQALSNVRAIARQHARVEHDLIPADTLRSDAEKKRMAEPVTFTVRLPGDGAGHTGQNGIRVDGFLYQQGRTYTRSRAVFESLQDIFYRAHLNEVRFRTLDQHKPGNSAVEVLAGRIPPFEVKHAA